MDKVKFFPADLNNLYEMLDFVRSHAKAMGFDSCYLNKIELATEEVLVNIINYGYPEKGGKIGIECEITTNSVLKITIQDEGIPYNPLECDQKCNLDANVEEKTVGGYGIFFILNLMDEVNYRREKNTNILTLKKFHHV